MRLGETARSRLGEEGVLQPASGESRETGSGLESPHHIVVQGWGATCPAEAQQFSIWKRQRRAVVCCGSQSHPITNLATERRPWEADSRLKQAPRQQSHRKFAKNHGKLNGRSRLRAFHKL